MNIKNATNIILAIYKTTVTDVNGEKTHYLKTQATVSTSDFQEYSVGLMGGNSRHICYHINIPRPISKVKLGFMNEVEEKIANIETSLPEEQIEEEIMKRLNEYELEAMIKENQEQKAGLKVGKLHYGLDELVEIKKLFNRVRRDIMKQQVVVNGQNINLDLVNIIEKSEDAHIKFFEDKNSMLHQNRKARRKRGKK